MTLFTKINSKNKFTIFLIIIISILSSVFLLYFVYKRENLSENRIVSCFQQQECDPKEVVIKCSPNEVVVKECDFNAFSSDDLYEMFFRKQLNEIFTLDLIEFLKNYDNVYAKELYIKHFSNKNFRKYLRLQSLHGDIIGNVINESLLYDHFFPQINKHWGRYVAGYPKTPAPLKIRIISLHFNRLDLLKLQHESVMNFVMDENVEYVIVNNAITAENIKKIKNKKLRDHYIVQIMNETNIKEIIEDYCKKNSDTITYDYFSHLVAEQNAVGKTGKYIHEKYIMGYDGLVVVIDGDSVFYDKIHLADFFETNDIIVGGVAMYTRFDNGKYIRHFTNQLVLIDPKRAPDLEKFDWYSPGSIKGARQATDSGINTHVYIENHPELKKRNMYFISHLFIRKKDVNSIRERRFREFLMEERKVIESGKIGRFYNGVIEEIKLIHYTRGGNWNENIEGNLKRGLIWTKYFTEMFKWGTNRKEVFYGKT